MVVSDALESSSFGFQPNATPSQLTDLKWWTSRESNPERLSANQKLSRLTTRPWGRYRESNSIDRGHNPARQPLSPYPPRKSNSVATINQ
jgi:hypothetical protein